MIRNDDDLFSRLESVNRELKDITNYLMEDIHNIHYIDQADKSVHMMRLATDIAFRIKLSHR